MAQKKSWRDLTPLQQRAIIAGTAAEMLLSAYTLRDLRRRPADAVRGPKLLWVLGCAVQPFGPLAYLAVGRRR